MDMEMMKTRGCPNPVPGESDVYVIGEKPHLSVAFEDWDEAPLMCTIQTNPKLNMTLTAPLTHCCSVCLTQNDRHCISLAHSFQPIKNTEHDPADRDGLDQGGCCMDDQAC